MNARVFMNILTHSFSHSRRFFWSDASSPFPSSASVWTGSYEEPENSTPCAHEQPLWRHSRYRVGARGCRLLRNKVATPGVLSVKKRFRRRLRSLRHAPLWLRCASGAVHTMRAAWNQFIARAFVFGMRSSDHNALSYFLYYETRAREYNFYPTTTS